jgi:hypothetical protein
MCCEVEDDDYFTPEEIAKILDARASDDWTNWRDIRQDL